MQDAAQGVVEETTGATICLASGALQVRKPGRCAAPGLLRWTPAPERTASSSALG